MSGQMHLPWHPHHPSGEKNLLHGVNLAAPLHTGYMYKQAHTHLVFHKRFFVLFHEALVYYEKEADYDRDVARGTLEHRHKAVGLEALYLTKPEKKPKGARYCFTLHAPAKCNERSDILLVTDTKEDRKHWIEALQARNPSLLDPTHHAAPIQPDTPQPQRKIRANSQNPPPPPPSSSSGAEVVSRNESANSLRSLVTTSITVADVDVHTQSNGRSETTRPGSPTRDLFRLTSAESVSSGHDTDHLHLDIQHLDIMEGSSDVEDN